MEMIVEFLKSELGIALISAIAVAIIAKVDKSNTVSGLLKKIVAGLDSKKKQI